MLFKELSIVILLCFLSHGSTGQEARINSPITLFIGCRYQLDERTRLDRYKLFGIDDNFSMHLVPYIEAEYHKNNAVIQLSFGYYSGGDTLSRYGSSGHPDFHFAPYYPPHSYTSDSWSVIQSYSYFTTRFAFSGRLFKDSWFNLDLGGFYAFDNLVKSESSDYLRFRQSRAE